MELSRQSFIILSITIVTTFASFVKSSLPRGLQTLNISSEITTDPNITASFATDFGNLFNCTPGAVFYPSSPNDIAALIHFSYTSSKSFPISQRGLGHSTYGQTFVPDGVLIDMSSLGRRSGRINVTDGLIPYVDVGAEQLWIDVLNATLKHDLMPSMLTDYLSLTVGGTLSNAGISGQEFKHGPQISNVYELDVVTGTGDIVTCSREFNPDLFYAALGGLGQFGVITRARIALKPAQKRVRWSRLFYTDIKLVTSDSEKLTSPDNNLSGIIDFLEGEVLLSTAQASLIGSTFNFTNSDVQKIIDLASENNGPIYFLDAVVFYNDTTATSAEQKVELLLKELQYTSGFAYSYDIPLLNFLNRLHYQETSRSSEGKFHPWLVMFVPKSKILEFDSSVYKGILKGTNTAGSLLIYPMNRTLWDDEMSAVTPNAEVFYTADLLWTTSEANDTKNIAIKNNQIQNFCEQLGCKEYLPHYTNQVEWQKQFGKKWGKFVSRKMKYDPKALLSSGQRIFTPSGTN